MRRSSDLRACGTVMATTREYPVRDRADREGHARLDVGLCGILLIVFLSDRSKRAKR
jgi:hypothetical protein